MGLFLCAPSPQLRQRKHSSLESVLKPKTATGKGSAPSRIGTIFHGATKIGTKMVQEHGQRAPLTINQSTNQPMFQCGSVFSHGPFGGIDFCWGEWDPISEIPNIWAEEFHLFVLETSDASLFVHWLHIDDARHVIFLFDFYQPLQHNSCATSVMSFPPFQSNQLVSSN